MNFVEAAITLLQEAGKPLPVETLCELALERGLLDRPGTSPLRSMKGRLTTELHRGDDSRLAKLDDDTWTLREGSGPVAGEVEEEPEGDPEGLEPVADGGEDDDEDDDVEDQFGEDFGDLGEDDDLDDEDDDLAAADDDLDEDDDDDDDEDDDDDLDDDDEDDDDELAAEDDDDELTDEDDDEEDDDEPAPGMIAEPLPDSGVVADAVEDTVSPPAVHAGEPEPAPEEGERPRGRRRRRRRRRGGRGREGAPGEGAAAGAEGGEVVPIAGQVAEELDDEEEDEEDLPEPEPLVPAGPEEEEFARVYSEVLDGTTPLGEVREYSDHQTADEDRPMLPEIKADRRAHMRSRRDERRSRREKERAARAERRRDRDRPGEAREGRESREPSAAGGGELAARATLADLAYTTLASLQNGQAIHCGQLAQMMRKRDLISGDPGTMAPLIKAALIDDTNARLERGLRPRVDHRGRGTFAARPLPDDPLRRAERAVADAMAKLELATRAAVKARVARLGQAALERLCHLWLERTGWQEVQWIKRSGPSSYALAETPFARERWLIGVRSGNDLVDRRGIGELRAGVTAKDLAQGLLVAPRGLSEEAHAELCKEGRPLTLVCGDELVTALVRAGVGVVTASARIAYPDSELFDELP